MSLYEPVPGQRPPVNPTATSQQPPTVVETVPIVEPPQVGPWHLPTPVEAGLRVPTRPPEALTRVRQTRLTETQRVALNRYLARNGIRLEVQDLNLRMPVSETSEAVAARKPTAVYPAPPPKTGILGLGLIQTDASPVLRDAASNRPLLSSILGR